MKYHTVILIRVELRGRRHLCHAPSRPRAVLVVRRPVPLGLLYRLPQGLLAGAVRGPLLVPENPVSEVFELGKDSV